MKDKREIISFIENIRDNVINNKYLSEVDLEKDFYKIKKYIWEDIDYLDDSDLSNVSDIHNFLIEKVINIHLLEEDSNNKEILSNNIKYCDIKDKLNDGKRACNIYSLTNSNYEYYLIGDLHSDTISLKKIIEACNFFESIINKENIRLVFLGDYVDRGAAHLEIIEFVLLLKYIFPNNIYLLRGNHDGGNILDSEVKLCVGREKESLDEYYFLLFTHNLCKVNKTFNIETVNNYLKFFNSLCNIAIISIGNNNILGVHGGIPRPNVDLNNKFSYINTMSDLTNEDIKDHIDRSITHNMRWSDPSENMEEVDLNKGRFKFHKDHFIEFMDKLGLDILIRGHEAESEGVKEYFDKRLFTLFSSGIILDKNKINLNTETYYKEVNPKIIKANKEKGIVVLDINEED